MTKRTESEERSDNYMEALIQSLKIADLHESAEDNDQPAPASQDDGDDNDGHTTTTTTSRRESFESSRRPHTQPVGAAVLKFPMDPSPPHVPLPRKLTMHLPWNAAATDGTRHLGDDDDATPELFAVSFCPRGSDKTAGGQACVVLHNGTEATDPALAMVPAEDHLWKGWTKAPSNLYLPHRPDDADPVGVAVQGKFIHRTARLFMDSSKGRAWGHFFADCAGSRKPQWFTWVGAEADGGGGGGEFRHHLELIRGEGHGPNVGRAEGDLGKAIAYARFDGMLALNRVFQIEFLDNSQVELGHRWAVTAIITALRLRSLVTTPSGRLLPN